MPAIERGGGVRWFPGVLALLGAVACPLSGAGALTFDGQPKVLLHVTPAMGKNPCTAVDLADCRTASTSGDLSAGMGPFHFAYLLVARGDLDGISGLQCGISYDDDRPGDASNGNAIDVFAWHHCATRDLPAPGPPTWPDPGGANIILWGTDPCQRGETAVAGYFYMGAYDPDSLYVTPWPFDGRFAVTDCSAAEIILHRKSGGVASFTPGGNAPGCNPCLEGCFAPEGPPAPPPGAAPKILLHVTPVLSTNTCLSPILPDCRNAVVAGGLSTPGGPFFFVHLLVSRSTAALNVGSIRCGITYERNQAGDARNGLGIDVFQWNLCASGEITGAGPNRWPEPGSGNLISWVKCPQSAVVTAGYFYVAAYSRDRFQLIPYPADEPTDVQTCGGYSFVLDERYLGSAVFSPGGTAGGCNPCLVDCSLPLPVRETTWSGIKSLFPR